MATDGYATAMQNACPAGLGMDLATVSFATEEEFARSTELMRRAEANEDCATAFARFLAAKYLDRRERQSGAVLLGLALRLPQARRAEAAPEIRRALQAMPLAADNARSYFRALLAYDLDLRAQYADRFPAGSLTGADDPDMSYFLYLADMQDPRGLAELDRAATRLEADPHALIGVLMRIADLQRADASHIFLRYLKDSRRGIGVNGPGTGPSVDLAAQRGLVAMEHR